MTEIQKELFNLEDLSYRDFHSKLIPNVSKENIIGIRVPVLRSYAKKLYKSGEYNDFLNELPHKYYEENNLHAFIIENITDFDLCIKEVESFLPFVDNWATCDSLRPKVFKKNVEKLLPYIKKWIKSDKPYVIRFGIEMLMCYYLEEGFEKEYSDWVFGVNSEDYYVNMMIAWYFATALAKQYDLVLPYIQNGHLPLWVHNKTIQKAIESYRITDENKKYLRTLKR